MSVLLRQQLSMSQFMTPSKTVTTRLRQVVQDPGPCMLERLGMSRHTAWSDTCTRRSFAHANALMQSNALEDVLLEPFADLLAGACLVPDPAKRSSAQAALKHPFLSKPRCRGLERVEVTRY